MRHKWVLILVLFFAALAIAFLTGVCAYVFTSDRTASSFSLLGGDKVGVITIEGTILTSDETIEQIEELRKNKHIASVIIRIESPGGAVGASQEINEAIRLLAKEKPVIASMGTVGTSGAYHIACGTQRIMASPGSITGSIGVRMEHVMLGDLLKWAKVGHETLKSGKYKDIGTFDRPLTEEERAILQGLLDDLHEQFKEDVAEARHLSMEAVNALADGRVFTGRQALALGLIDGLGGFAQAIRTAAELGGIKGEPELSFPSKKSKLWESLMESASSIKKAFLKESIDYWRPVMSLETADTHETMKGGDLE